jgi:hypothetical protein
MIHWPLAMPATGPTLYHVPKTISSPIYQILLHLHLNSYILWPQVPTTLGLKSHGDISCIYRWQRGNSNVGVWRSFILHITNVWYFLSTSSESKILFELGICQVFARTAIYHCNIVSVHSIVIHSYIGDVVTVEEQDAVYVQSTKEKFIKLLAPTLLSFFLTMMVNSSSGREFLQLITFLRNH